MRALRTRIYGVSVVQNEADIVGESLERAARFCEQIWVWDLGSADGTWDVLTSLKLPNVSACQRREEYRSSLRGRVFEENRSSVAPDSWIYILDADEFLVGDPRPVLETAEEEGTSLVGAWQANFFPTEADLKRLQAVGEEQWARTPIANRLRHYRVEWFEWRFVRALPDLAWDTSGIYSRIRHADGRPLRAAKQGMIVRHYRYRTPNQVSLRVSTRARGTLDRRFRYDRTGVFERQVRPADECLLWPEEQAELVVPRSEILRGRFRRLAGLLLRRIQRTARRIMSRIPES